MAKTIASYGLTLSPELINSLNNHNHLGFDQDGSNSPITNAELSPESGQILSDFYAFNDQLKVTHSGLQLLVSVGPGQVLLPSGELRYVIAQAIALLDNAQQLIIVNQSGQVVQSLTLPLGAVPLARVTCQSGAVLSIQDLRPQSTLILPNGQSSNGQVFSEAKQSLDQFQAYQDISVGSPVSLRQDGKIETLNAQNWGSWAGIAQSPIARSSFGPVALPGQIDRVRVSLAPGQNYYISYTTGTITRTKSLTTFFVGRAISSMSLLLALAQN